MGKKVVYDGSDWKLEEAEVVSFDRNDSGHLHVLLQFVGVDGKQHAWNFTAAYNDDLIEAAIVRAAELIKDCPDGAILMSCGYQCGRMLPPRVLAWDGEDDE